jgi:hypothetical protein
MKGSPWHQWLAVAVCAGMLSVVIVLAGCEPEQTPASAARTAAAVRTPAAAPVAQSTAGAPPTLAPAALVVTAQPKPEVGPASLTASPNPVPVGAGQMASTTIAWNTGQPQAGQVYVSENGGSETLFSSGATGSQAAPWIKADHRYEFHLYAGTSRDQLLAALTIGNPPAGAAATPVPNLPTGAAATPVPNPAVATDLTAEPNPVPADDEELGTTNINWRSAAGGNIYVSQDDGPEQLFASGIRGTEQANWICRGSTYEFRLYAGSQRTAPLKTVIVTRAEDAPDHEPPPVVECKGSPGP